MEWLWAVMTLERERPTWLMKGNPCTQDKPTLQTPHPQTHNLAVQTQLEHTLPFLAIKTAEDQRVVCGGDSSVGDA